MKEPLGLNYSGSLNFVLIYSFPVGPYTVKEILLDFFFPIKFECAHLDSSTGAQLQRGGGLYHRTISLSSKNREADYLTPFPGKPFSWWDDSVPQKSTGGGPKLGQLH